MVRPGVRRLSWGLTDQAATSITTLLISVAALQGATEAAAEFAIVFIGYSLAVGLCRSITTEPAAPELPGLPEGDVRAHVRAAAVTGLAIGLLTALLCALLLRPDTTLGLWSLALPVAAVPVDSVRAAWIGSGRAPWAARFSLAQLAAAVVGFVVTLVTDSAAWALAPVVAVSAVLALVALVGRGSHMTAAHLRPRHWVYATEWSLTYGIAQSSSLVLATLGLPLLPLLLRAQGVVFGPLFSLSQAVAALAVPEFVSLRRRRPALLPAAVGLSVGLIGVCAVYAALVLLVPDAVLAAVLGSSWPEFEPLLIASAASVVVGGAAMGPLVAMRAHGAARTSLLCRVVIGVAGLVLPVTGALVWGMAGFFLAAAVASVIGAVWSSFALRRWERAAARDDRPTEAQQQAAR